MIFAVLVTDGIVGACSRFFAQNILIMIIVAVRPCLDCQPHDASGNSGQKRIGPVPLLLSLHVYMSPAQLLPACSP